MFLGLLTERGTEPEADAGYHRVDLSRYSFGISPAREEGETFTFINLSEIVMPRATKSWGTLVTIAIFDEADAAEPRHSFPLIKSSYVGGKVSVSFARSHLSIGVRP